MFFLKGKKKPKKQLILFHEALLEAGNLVQKSDLKIDHQSAKCYYQLREFNVVFPLRYLREIKKLNFKKEFDFTFKGLYTPKREWVCEFESANSKVTFTSNGRKIPKEFFDGDFYQEMCQSKFTLCPAGDFKWTYRFLEAIACRSIPIIESGSENPQCKNFIYFLSNRSKNDLLSLYDEEIVEHNYKLFLKRHTLLDYFIFL